MQSLFKKKSLNIYHLGLKKNMSITVSHKVYERMT